ncbi:MAG: hypothetical protein LBV27_02435 [Oscillospiraceae bacterium]|nr:hypothetical protein [Oscillospiraceae bacterium]
MPDINQTLIIPIKADKNERCVLGKTRSERRFYRSFLTDIGINTLTFIKRYGGPFGGRRIFMLIRFCYPRERFKESHPVYTACLKKRLAVLRLSILS